LEKSHVYSEGIAAEFGGNLNGLSYCMLKYAEEIPKELTAERKKKKLEKVIHAERSDN